MTHTSRALDMGKQGPYFEDYTLEVLAPIQMGCAYLYLTIPPLRSHSAYL